MDQSTRSQLLSRSSLRELVEALGEKEDKPCGVMQGRISRLLADLLMRFGFLSDFPSS
jgi:hypothetical protein